MNLPAFVSSLRARAGAHEGDRLAGLILTALEVPAEEQAKTMVRVRPRWNAWDRVDEVRLADVYGVHWGHHPGGAGKMLRAEVGGRKVYITLTDNDLSVFAEVCRRVGAPSGTPTPPLRWGEPPPRLRG